MNNRYHLIILLAGMLLSACTQHTAYRPLTHPTSLPVSEDLQLKDPHSIQHRSYYSHQKKNGKYYLSFVEFDDQGWFVEREQMDSLLRLLDDLQKNDPEKRVLIQVYAHGWKHNAGPGDNNVVCFSRLLERTDVIEREVLGLDRTVVGVYVGWRGLPYEAGELSNFSFWTRKNTAARVGRGGVFELLTRLNDYRNRRRQKDQQERQEKIAPLEAKITILKNKVENVTPHEDLQSAKNELKDAVDNLDYFLADNPMHHKTQLMITGHSFGGLVIYSALSHALMEQAAKAHYKPTESASEEATSMVKGFGDFVMLVNPAFEGSLYEPLHQIAQKSSYASGQRPLMMIVTSKADAATRLAFPLGQKLGTLLQHVKDPAQKASLEKTIGHNKAYRTHDLVDRGVHLFDQDNNEVRLWLADERDSQWQDKYSKALASGGQSVSDEFLGDLIKTLEDKDFQRFSKEGPAPAGKPGLDGWIEVRKIDERTEVPEGEKETTRFFAIPENSYIDRRDAFKSMKEAVLSAYPETTVVPDSDCPHLPATDVWNIDSLLLGVFEAFVDAGLGPRKIGSSSFGANVSLEAYRYEPPYPFLVVSTDQPIIADHNSIYSDDFITFTQMLFYLSVVFPGELPGSSSKEAAQQ